MLKYHSLHGHLYYYIGDYRTYLPNSDQLRFIYRGTDRAHDDLPPRSDKYVQDYVHDISGCQIRWPQSRGGSSPPLGTLLQTKAKK